MLLLFQRQPFLSHSLFSVLGNWLLQYGICGPKAAWLDTRCTVPRRYEVWKLRCWASLMYLFLPPKKKKKIWRTTQCQWLGISKSLIFHVPPGTVWSVPEKRTSFVSCHFFSGWKSERHKHSLKMKATKINSKQPCVKTLMQNMQAGFLFIRQKAVRRARPG